jgi:hypothetical protein
MKKAIALLLLAGSAWAQPSVPARQIHFVATDPTGSCGNSYITVNITTGVITTCQGGTWGVSGSTTFVRLSGDASSTSIGGATVVNGFKGVPFCTGYTPTNGQFVELTTASSPNPCYTATAAIGGTGNAGATVTVTNSATPTFTCPSATAGTVVLFEMASALSQNITGSTLSGCTGSASLASLLVFSLTEPTGAYYTVVWPTGLSQLGQPNPAGASAVTTTLACLWDGTTCHVPNSADVGPGVNPTDSVAGLMKLAGASGVTAHMLVCKDTSNPVKYNTCAAGQSGSGVAANTAAAGLPFILQATDGQEYTFTAQGAVTAGHVAIAADTVGGEVMDSGYTSRTSIGTSVATIGTFSANATDTSPVVIKYDGVGTYGTLVTTVNGTTVAASSAADQLLTTTASGVSVWEAASNCVAAGGVTQYSTATHALTCHTLALSDLPVLHGQCTEAWGGSGTSFALTSGDDAIVNNSCYNDSGATRTITAVKCRSDAASNGVYVNPTFGAGGTGETILTGNLTCGNSYAYSATGTLDTGAHIAWVTGTGIDPGMGGTLTGSTSIALLVEYTYQPF